MTRRLVLRRAVTGLSVLAVWVALVGPDRLDRLTPGGLLQLPVEGLVLVAASLAVPSRARTAVAAVIGLLLGLTAVVRLLDMGFYEMLDRPFNPVTDWSYLGPALGVLRDSIGPTRTRLAEVGGLLLVLALLILLPLAVIRVSRLTVHHRRGSTRAVVALGVVWVLLAVAGARAGSNPPLASSTPTATLVGQVEAVRHTIRDEHTFDAALVAPDHFAITPPDSLLRGLRGKDVIFAVVESYGQVAVQGSSFAAGVDATLRTCTTRLAAAGFSARSAFLTSPTFGGVSWLAHSTLQSGLWVDTQQRYNRLVASTRFTLSDAFHRAGWRTVGDVPSNTGPWPQGTSFYHYDRLYNATDVGYAGPRFSYAAMPDQYTLAAFHRLELAKAHRRPVMAEIDLVSSHTPWTPLPHLVPWGQLGDGSVFDGMPQRGPAPDRVWPDTTRVRSVYAQSIRYSVSSVVSFVQNAHDPNLVVVMFGDHQPSAIVSGDGANHQVPMTIIARPDVLARISSWGWQGGMLPGPQAPVWPMNDFRDRFLTGYARP